MDAAVIFNYFPHLSETQRNQFIQLGSLYEEWNSKINVISRKDMASFYVHHVLHSLSIAKFVSFKPGTQIMDAGTGGGFPGIPMAILFPESRFFLVDSIGKKIKVVNAVAESLKLTNVKSEQIRMEKVNKTFDFVISRAVTDLETFSRWTLYKIHSRSVNKIPNGIIYLKGINIDDEISRVKKIKGVKVKTKLLSDFFKEDFFTSKQIVHVYK